ncbi:TRAP transporter substrate-binding protein [Bacillus sp. Marseille-P3661]|uniref:TRAP transporter substrate-binding protein n=1 Tax=Bacillus sp. Marseille-P3661 TaxID=1936234 RepID=UPI000C840B0C|nr:TRAP transporter substrate-binding protein [Bacillus sp. Marseille-P3661]
MNKLKKLSLIGLLSLVFLVMAACGSDEATSNEGTSEGEGASGKVYEWDMASIYSEPTSSDTFGYSLGLGQQKFVELVKEKTNGQVIIKAHYNGVLGDALELFQKVRRGDLDVFYGQPMSSVDERFGAWSIPYLFSDYEQVEKIASDPNGAIFKLSEQWIAEHDLKLLAVGPSAFRGFANSKHPVVTPEDLNDLKVRTYQDPIVSIFWEGVSNAAPLPFSEVYTALETNTIDGLEFQATSLIQRKMDEVTKYYTDIDWQWTSGANVIVPKKLWDELPADLQKAVQEAAVEAMKYQGELQKEDDKSALDKLEENGVEVHRLTPEERQKWSDYARSLDSKFSEAIGEEVYNAVIEAVESSK